MIKKKNPNYEEVAKNIIADIGGRENVNSVRHCITRVRFRLKDESKTDDEIVENLEGIFSVVHEGGEYVAVIDDAVEDMHGAVCVQLRMQNGAGSETKVEEEKKVSPIIRILNMIIGVVLPCLNMICVGGTIGGLQTVLQMIGIIPSDNGIDLIISAMGDAIFFSLPIFLGMNLVKTLKGDGFLGALIGTILYYPTINSVSLKLSGRAINTTYTSPFLPVIAVTVIAILLAKWLNKYIPRVIANFVTPVIILAIVTPFGFILIESAVNMAGSLMNMGITALLDTAPLLADAISSVLYQVMVLFGIHTVLTSFSFVSLLGKNPDAVMTVSCLVYFAQTGVVLGIYYKTRDRKLRSIVLPAFISGLSGITEPAIYGVTLPHIKMFVLLCVGADITGTIIMLTGTKMYSFGLGIFVALGVVNPEAPNFTPPLLAVIVPFVVSLTLAYALHKDEAVPTSDSVQIILGNETAAHEKLIIESPVPGKVVLVSRVPDETFSNDILGKGFVVGPSEGKAYVPLDGTCVTILETLHVTGLESSNGVNLLIHVGLETVGLNGKPFKAYVGSGDNIKKGQLLSESDTGEIKATGCPVITSVLVTNESEVDKVATENSKVVIGG